MKANIKLFPENNINQYIFSCKEGKWDYFENIYVLYKPFINFLANKYFYKDGEIDDLKQQGLIGLYYAIKRFDIRKNKSFDPLAKLCIKKSMLQAIRSSNAKKQLIHNNSVFLYDVIGDNFVILDTIINKEDELPEDLLVKKEQYIEFNNLYSESLTSLELDVFNLYIDGYRPKDIALKLDINYKSVDNALGRVKLKLKSKKELRQIIYRQGAR